MPALATVLPSISAGLGASVSSAGTAGKTSTSDSPASGKSCVANVPPPPEESSSVRRTLRLSPAAIELLHGSNLLP